MSTALAEKPAHVASDRVVDADIYALPGITDDFHAAWHDLQVNSPDIAWTPRNEGHWIAMRGDIIAEVLGDHEHFSSRIIIVPKSVGEQHGLLPTTLDPPVHRPYRQLFSSSFTPGAIRKLAPSIRETAIDLIEKFLARGHCDFTAEYARLFPVRIFMAMVDLPMSDAATIQHWAECMTRPDRDMTFEEAKQAFFRYVEPILDARRAQPGDDLISRMITGDLNGRMPDAQEAVALVTQILIAGVDTVVNFLGFAMLYLAETPEAQRALAASPDTIIRITGELFRRYGLVTIARTVVNDMEFHGVQLKAGELVATPTRLHGLDDRQNSDPMKVDFTRRDGRHTTFGTGAHICVGQELARAEVAITIEEWLKRIPAFSVADDADTHAEGGIVGSIRRLCLRWDTTSA